MTDIVSFLLQRIAEDEGVARAALDAPGSTWWVNSREQTIVRGDPSTRAPIAEALSWRAAAHIARHDPARVLAECEAKRRIVGVDAAPEWPQEDDRYTLGWQDAAQATLRFLALPYADHPDYDQEWRLGVS